MNFQQLRILRETIRHKFNVTDVASALFVSQSGVSKHIKEFEDELGAPIFQRRGRRLLGLTELGEHIIPMVERILTEASNIQEAASDFEKGDQGRLRIATTHMLARYVLPPIILKFKQTSPTIKLDIQQHSSKEIPLLLREGKTDIGIATGAFAGIDDITSQVIPS